MTDCPPILLIVGLGNPGPTYEGTRHNLGFDFLDAYLSHKSYAPCQPHKKFLGHYHRHRQQHFLKPTTFMNLSGESVQAVCDYYHIPAQQVLIIHDELDLPCGDIRLKYDGGTAGHNGLKSIQSHLKTTAFWRLRMGIGRPLNKAIPIADYVLSKPSLTEQQEQHQHFGQGFICCDYLCTIGQLAEARAALKKLI